MPKKANHKLRNSTLNRNKGLTRKKRMPQESKKRKGQRSIYNDLVRELLRENPDCEARVPGYCSGPSTQNHHMKRRGKHYLDKETFLAVCFECHDWIEKHGDSARERGLLGLTRTEYYDRLPASINGDIVRGAGVFEKHRD